MDYEKKYKEALGWMQSLYNGLHGKTKEEAERYFPELKDEDENADEKVRKALIKLVTNHASMDLFIEYDIHSYEALSWLEKQGQVKESIISQHENKICKESNDSLTSEDERIRKDIVTYLKSILSNKKYGDKFIESWIAWLEKQGWQKSADKIELKFKVGDTVIDPYGGLYHITEIIDDSYKTDDGRFILFKNQEVYTLSNFTAWSKEDKEMYKKVETAIDSYYAPFSRDAEEMSEWFKNLKDRVQPQQSQWRPSENELEVLRLVAEKDGTCLMGLYKNLKKLMEE